AREDIRGVKFRRWESSVGSGVYNKYLDPGGGEDFDDFYMFGNNRETVGNCTSINITQELFLDGFIYTVDQMTNTIFGSSCNNIEAEGYMVDCTVGNNVFVLNSNSIFRSAIVNNCRVLYFRGGSFNVNLGQNC